MIHKPVLPGEVMENLNLAPGMTVVDGTLGAGGHSTAILERILPGGRLISIDWDERAVEEFKIKLQKGIFVAKRGLIRVVGPVPANNNKNDDRASHQFLKLGNRGGKIVGCWCGQPPTMQK